MSRHTVSPHDRSSLRDASFGYKSLDSLNVILPIDIGALKQEESGLTAVLDLVWWRPAKDTEDEDHERDDHEKDVDGRE
jgi:hypothetical protein